MREAPWSAGERATKKEHTSASAREKVSGLECKHRLVSRAPRGSEGGDDSPQSKADDVAIHRDEECAKVH
ncbi:MAG: hypothetical protein AB1742_15550 [bacterium]